MLYSTCSEKKIKLYFFFRCHWNKRLLLYKILLYTIILNVYVFFLCFFYFQVSWVKRRGEELNLITFGRHTYSSDSRYSLEYQAPNDWQLLIQYANERDEGHYECQVSAHPPLVLLVYLTVVGKHFKYYLYL